MSEDLHERAAQQLDNRYPPDVLIRESPNKRKERRRLLLKAMFWVFTVLTWGAAALSIFVDAISESGSALMDGLIGFIDQHAMSLVFLGGVSFAIAAFLTFRRAPRWASSVRNRVVVLCLNFLTLVAEHILKETPRLLTEARRNPTWEISLHNAIAGVIRLDELGHKLDQTLKISDVADLNALCQTTSAHAETIVSQISACSIVSQEFRHHWEQTKGIVDLIQKVFPVAIGRLPIVVDPNEVVLNEANAEEVFVVSNDMEIDLNKNPDNEQFRKLFERVKDRNRDWLDKWIRWWESYRSWKEAERYWGTEWYQDDVLRQGEAAEDGRYNDEVLYEDEPKPPYLYVIPETIAVGNASLTEEYLHIHFSNLSAGGLRADQKASIKRSLFLPIDPNYFDIFGPSPERTTHVYENPDDRDRSALLVILKPSALTHLHAGKLDTEPLMLRYENFEYDRYVESFRSFWFTRKRIDFARSGLSFLYLLDIPEMLEHRAKRIWVVSPDLGVDLTVEEFGSVIGPKLRMMRTRHSGSPDWMFEYEYRYIVPEWLRPSNWESYQPASDSSPQYYVPPPYRSGAAWEKGHANQHASKACNVVKHFVDKYLDSDEKWLNFFFTFVSSDEFLRISQFGETTLYEVDVLCEPGTPEWQSFLDNENPDKVRPLIPRKALVVFFPTHSDLRWGGTEAGGKDHPDYHSYDRNVYMATPEKQSEFEDEFSILWENNNMFWQTLPQSLRRSLPEPSDPEERRRRLRDRNKKVFLLYAAQAYHQVIQ